jgi:hypothetical protein
LTGTATVAPARSPAADADGDFTPRRELATMCADTFGVGIHVTETELRVVVGVPSDIDAGWTDPEAFQSLVAEAVWERLDRRSTLETVSARYDAGETAPLGSVTLEPDGTVVETDLKPIAEADGRGETEG